ncbi:MAG: hypothetical protein E6K03_05740 [Methanobacteriota archaeon]|nr:MAG: hypothetical protein E6K03_05740 [Euryarchaeota archaeon]
MQAQDLQKRHAIRQDVQIVPTPGDREVVQAAHRRLLDDPGDVDALFAVAAWDEIVGDQDQALELLNRLVSRKPDYPGVWWLRARILKDLGRPRDAIACEEIARMYAEPEIPEYVRKFPF